jgi:tripartite-type tricarboxylate transporter receptor subunit TctC
MHEEVRPGMTSKDKTRSLLCAFALGATFGIIGGATAQTYPSHPTTLVVAASAGEPADVLARILVEPMARWIGQPIQIENVDATDAFRVGRLARAAPDGYTFGISSRNYDLHNLRPVALLPSVPAWIVGRNTLPARDLNELIAWLKANSDAARSGVLGSGAPGKASAGFVDSTGPGYICELLLQRNASSFVRPVPYYSAVSMFRGLLRGQIDFVCDRAADSVAMVRAGLIRAHAVMAKSRWFKMPDIAIGDEMGAPDIYISYWHGLWVPKGTPDDIIVKLNAAAFHAMADA